MRSAMHGALLGLRIWRPEHRVEDGNTACVPRGVRDLRADLQANLSGFLQSYGLLLLFVAALLIHLWIAKDVRGSAAERLIDRFRLNAKPPEAPRRSLFWKIRDARDSRARAKEIRDSLTFRPPSKRPPDA